MFEKLHQPIASRHYFIWRLAKNFLIAFVLILIALGLGMLGYHYYEDLSWTDSYANAAMILSGMGPLTPMKTDSGRLFAGSYALFSGLFFILIMGLILTPVVHRFLHHFHLKEEDNKTIKK